MRCDQCQNWKSKSDNAEWEPQRAGFGECMAVRERWRIMDEASEGMKWGSGDEAWDKHDSGATPPPNSYTGVRIAALVAARAYVQDGSEYRAELFTAPNFFCAKFDPVGKEVSKSAEPVPS